jgi:hypothetical protein
MVSFAKIRTCFKHAINYSKPALLFNTKTMRYCFISINEYSIKSGCTTYVVRYVNIAY